MSDLQNETGLSDEELAAEGVTALPDKEVVSILDLNADIDLNLDVAAPVDLAVAANANVAAPIDAAVGANVLSEGSTAQALSDQGVLIDQGIDADATATAEQGSVIDQTGEGAEGAARTVSLRSRSPAMRPRTPSAARSPVRAIPWATPSGALSTGPGTPVGDTVGGAAGWRAVDGVDTSGLLDGNLLNVDVNLDADAGLTAPIAGAVAANANVAAPIDAAVAANIGSVDSDAVAISQQDAIITQDITGSAEATTAQESVIGQGDPAPARACRQALLIRPLLSRSTLRTRPTTPRTPAVTHSDDRRRPHRDNVTVVEEVPVRTEGLQLIGEMHGSGYRVPPALVRRPDGQTLQLTPLLYAVLEAADGTRSVDQIACTASQSAGRPLTADNVTRSSRRSCARSASSCAADGSAAGAASAAIRSWHCGPRCRSPIRTPRVGLLIPSAVLFHPLVWAPLSTVFLVVCWWLLFDKGLASATYQAFQSPGLLLLVVAVTVFSAGFHEFGHAAAARRGGAPPGVMGAGIYLVWPAFYTDVTDSYRLGRLGRVRTDLGGLYFNAVVAIAMRDRVVVDRVGRPAPGRRHPDLQMIRQLAPLVRFDGYHVLADLTRRS